MDRLYRLFASLGLLLASTFAVFALLKAAPGGPAAYLRVSQALAGRLPATLELAFCAFVAALVLGAIIGFLRARIRAPILRDVLAVSQFVGRALPVVILAQFVLLLNQFTAAPPGTAWWSVAPVLTLAVPFGAWSSLFFYNFFRASDDGLPISVRSIVNPVALTAAAIGPALLSASLLIEPMFAWPGTAFFFFTALSRFDVGLVAGFLLVYSAVIVLTKLCADVTLGIVDAVPRQTGSPRISANRSKKFSAIGVIAFVVLLGAAFGAVTANLIAPVGPYFIDQVHWVGYPLAPGVAGHPLGSDENGRDLLSRLLIALRTSLGIAAFAAFLAAAFGAVVAKAANAVRWFDDRVALSTTGIRPFATFPFITATVAVLVAHSHTVAVLTPFVIALVLAAVSWPAIVPAFRALTPATLGGVVDLTACALLLEVTLSFLGFGVQPPTPSLGNMLVNAQSNLAIAPWVTIVPSVVIVVILFALYAVADALRQMHEPE